jgi:hypothetical protein
LVLGFTGLKINLPKQGGNVVKGLAILLAFLALAAVAFGAELVLQPGSEGKDSMVSDYHSTTNFGTSAQLMVNFGSSRAVRGIVEFEGLSAIPKGSTVNSAAVELYSRANSPNDYFGIYRVTATWAEMTVTWSNQPAHYATAYAKVLVPSTGTYKFDVKTLVAEWVAGTYTNYGFILKRDNEAGSSWPYFCSSDHATADWRPKITVDYTPSAVTPISAGKVKALFK